MVDFLEKVYWIVSAIYIPWMFYKMASGSSKNQTPNQIGNPENSDCQQH